MNVDQYMALADFADYQKTQSEISKAYADTLGFAKMSLMNIGGAGVFSADRSIMDYANNIWHTKPVEFPQEIAKTAKKSMPMGAKSEKKTEKKPSRRKTAKKSK